MGFVRVGCRLHVEESTMPRMLLLPLNSCEVNEGPEFSRCVGLQGQWRGWAIMALRVLFFVALLLLADAQNAPKWPVSGDCQPCECSYKTTRFGRMRTVNCSRRGLNVIPANLPQDLMALDLSWNSLDVEQLRDQLCKFQSLQLVSLSFAHLNTLSDIFKECSSILDLNLTGNRLTQVDSKTFVGLKNLRRLLGLEVEMVVARDVFKNLTNLKDLDIIFHGEALPKGLFDNLVIQSLNLVVTQASSLPKRMLEFGQKTLNTLQLIGERVTQVHEDLLDGLCVLKKLYLVMPSVQQLPERFFHSQQMKPGDSRTTTRLANLQEVEISGVYTLPAKLFNQLVTLETLKLTEIGSFPKVEFLAGVISLRTLLITGSTLTSIPAGWFKELYSLKTLTLSELQLETLHDDVFEGLINLSYLDLSNNDLDQITSKMLMPLSKVLETLILRGNSLTEINKDYLGELRSLRHLDIGENRLANVYTNSFMGMTYLSVLYLNNNRLTSLPKGIFRDQLQLEFLSLADNYLVEFPEAILQLNRSLMSLDLALNELKEVPASQLCKFMYLGMVNIMSNYLHCDCSLLAFHHCPKITVEGGCKTPQQYQGMLIRDVEIPKSCAEVEENLDSNRTKSLLSFAKSALNESPVQSKQNDTIIRKLFTEELTNQSNGSVPELQNASSAEDDTTVANQMLSPDRNVSNSPAIQTELLKDSEGLLVSTSTLKDDTLGSDEEKSAASEAADHFLPKPAKETDKKGISLIKQELSHPQTRDGNTGQMKTAITSLQSSDQNVNTKEDKSTWQQLQPNNGKKASTRESSTENGLLRQEQNNETIHNFQQHSQANINDILKSYSGNPQNSNKEYSEQRIPFSKEISETTQQPKRQSADSVENTNITQQPIWENNQTDLQSNGENRGSIQKSNMENSQSTMLSNRQSKAQRYNGGYADSGTRKAASPNIVQNKKAKESLISENEKTSDQMMGDFPAQESGAQIKITENQNLTKVDVGKSSVFPSHSVNTSAVPVLSESSPLESSAKPSSQAYNDNAIPSKGTEQRPFNSFNKTETAEGPQNSNEYDTDFIATNVSKFWSQRFENNVEINNNYNVVSTATGVPFISSSERSPVVGVNVYNEPDGNRSSLIPEVEEIGNSQNNNASPTNMAFNFVISALVVLSVFGCVVLIIFFVHRWQQKGIYNISDQDNELNNLDSDVSEAASILPFDEPKCLV